MKFIRFLSFLSVLWLPLGTQAQVPAPALAARAWLLLDVGSGQTLAAEQPDSRVEPASLTKLMTAYLTFAAIQSGTIGLDQLVSVSETAWRATGSRMFLDPRLPTTVRELIHGMIIQSGNDACVALAETIAGSEQAFVQQMNQQAQRLGMKNTHFMNATGLTDPQHYTTARDLSLLATAVIRDFPDFYPIYAKKEFTYNKITQPNRNRLLWMDPTVDGLKTGHTDAAGYCLIASGKRNNRRLMSVVLGTASDTARAQESQRLLNYGFQAFDAVKLYGAGQNLSAFQVWRGKENQVNAGFVKDFIVSVPRGMANKIGVQLISQQPLLAPLQKGQQIGTLRLTLDGKPFGDYPVVALEEVPIAGVMGRAWDSVRLWIKRL
jgi:D-alanyl-D-alanine carboxypeptidase (penicillin-binding protein 5/6)